MTKKDEDNGIYSQDVALSEEFITKLNDFILLSIEIFANRSDEKQNEYYSFINDNIQIMNPLFFAAGEDFMKLVFEKTAADDKIKELFLQRWNTLKDLSTKIFEYVKLQINLMAHKNPEEDHKIWKDFIMVNFQLMNAEFFRLSRKVFLHLLNESVPDEKLKNSFIETWDKTASSIAKIQDIPTKN